MVEQLICNQQVAGSSPIASSCGALTKEDKRSGGRDFQKRAGSTRRLSAWRCTNLYGGVPERSKGPDCKSGATGFEGSNPSPSTRECGSSSVGRAPAFQAGCRGFEPRLPLWQASSITENPTTMRPAHVAQLVEHVLGKDEVSSSILLVGSPSILGLGLARTTFLTTTTLMTTTTNTDNAFFGRT
jgi:hypothetical protein